MNAHVLRLLFVLFFGACALHRRNRDGFAFCVHFLIAFALLWALPSWWARYWGWTHDTIWLPKSEEEKRLLQWLWSPVCAAWGLVFGDAMTEQNDAERGTDIQVLAYSIAGFLLVWNAPRACRMLPGMESYLERLPWSRADWLFAKGVWGAVSAFWGFGFAYWMMTPNAPLPGYRPLSWRFPGKAGALDGLLRKAVLKGRFGTKTFLGTAEKKTPVLIGERERDAHMQIVGPTRSGKSQLLLALAAQDMARGLPVFFMEAKGDLSDFEQFQKLSKISGREGAVRYFNPADPRSMTFNPVRPLPGQDAMSVANQIARAIGREPTATGEGQDYYRAVDFEKIQNMAEIFIETGREFTLKDCFHYFSSPRAREKAFDLCRVGALADAARTALKNNKDSTALAASFAPWTSGTMGRLLNADAPQIRLEEIFSGAELAYFCAPVGALQVLANPLGRMIIAGLLSAASKRQRSAAKPPSAAVIIDEFGEFATPVFASFLATVGSARLRTVLAHQDLGQLRKVRGMDPDAFESVVFNNTSGCKVCFRTPDPEDADFWAAAVGTFTTVADTEQIEAGIFGRDSRTGRRSRREVEMFKIHPNALKNLAPGTAMAVSAGGAECLLRTARVYPLLEGMTVPDLPQIEREPRPGLDLASAAGGGPRLNSDGVAQS